MSTKNETGLKSFDRLEGDGRIVKIWDEQEDGYWVLLSPEYHFDECSCVHGFTVKDIFEDLKKVELR